MDDRIPMLSANGPAPTPRIAEWWPRLKSHSVTRHFVGKPYQLTQNSLVLLPPICGKFIAHEMCQRFLELRAKMLRPLNAAEMEDFLRCPEVLARREWENDSVIRRFFFAGTAYFCTMEAKDGEYVADVVPYMYYHCGGWYGACCRIEDCVRPSDVFLCTPPAGKGDIGGRIYMQKFSPARRCRIRPRSRESLMYMAIQGGDDSPRSA